MAAQSLNQRIGYRVLKARQYARISALELAARASIHRNTVYRIESGMGSSLEALWKITRVLNITLDSLFEDQPLAIQLEMFNDQFPLSGNSNRRSDVLHTMQPGLGHKRPRAAKMPATSVVQGLRNGTDGF